MNDRYIPVKIENISIFNYNFLVLLKPDGAETVLPICIGAAEAHSIAAAYNHQPFPRPLTHDLMKNALSLLNCSIERIQVNDLRDGTFYARIFLDYGGHKEELDSRPSDAIALALRYEAPILVREDILRDNSVSLKHTREKAESNLVEAQEEAEEAANLSPLEQLRKRLEAAIRDERYEDAARLRDEIRDVEATGG